MNHPSFSPLFRTATRADVEKACEESDQVVSYEWDGPTIAITFKPECDHGPRLL